MSSRSEKEMNRVKKFMKVGRGFSDGAILLEDGATPCLSVCHKDCKVMDLIDRVCSQELHIAPIARIFMALCDPDTGVPLSPYHTLTQEEAKRRYQLRVFVNIQNSLQFQKMSKQAYQYYYVQLREDFVADRIYPRTTINTAVWMAAIDMAKEAHKKDLNYRDLIRSPKDLRRYMPKFLKDRCKKDEVVQNKLHDTFARFRKIHEDVHDLELYQTKYVEVYEKDIMCGKHIFRLKSKETMTRRGATMLVVLSWKEGIYQIKAGDPCENREDVCFIASVCGIKVVGITVTLSIRSLEDLPDQLPELTSLNFFDKKEAQSFAIIAHTYHRLKVDANGTILAGGLTPNEEFLRVGENPNDGLKMDLCHAPISSYDVTSRLSNNGMMTDGNFLIRASRNTNSAYTLSLCYDGSVMNYRIVYNEKAYSFQDPQNKGGNPHQKFPTMKELIDHHSQFTDGLPTLLLVNYAPCFTGPIPLLTETSSETSHESSLNEDDISSISSNSDSPISTSAEFNEQPLLPSHSPSILSPADQDSSETSYIKELVDKGVRYIEYSKLITKGELGHGHYSTVYLAELGSGNDAQKVAVKIPTMKEDNVDHAKKELMREILTMNSLKHQNVVNLLGISATKHYLNYIGFIPVMVMEFLHGGCLRSFLDKLNPKSRNIDKVKWDFLLYGRQIADGMSYLESRKVIHRDLATRNVLMVTVTHVKISDFGLARTHAGESKNYYKFQRAVDWPIYWYSPECLESYRFSTKGDVWSYGVTLWEMFTLGCKPPQYLIQLIQLNSANPYQQLAQWYKRSNNNRLPMLGCNFKLFREVIKKCWDINPEIRPSFDELSNIMDDKHRAVSGRFAPAVAEPSTAAISGDSGGNSQNALTLDSEGLSPTSTTTYENALRNPSPTVPTSAPVSPVTNSSELINPSITTTTTTRSSASASNELSGHTASSMPNGLIRT